jgi:hypothetical protein
MKILTFLLFSCSVLAVQAATPAAEKPSIAWLSWMNGAWAFERNGRETFENWIVSGDTMIGVSRTVVKGKTVEHEFLLIRPDENGNLYYIAKPSGQAETAFRLVRAPRGEAVFENLQHDFPQRIRYTLKTDGTMLAVIEGTKDGKTRRVEFPYRRQK